MHTGLSIKTFLLILFTWCFPFLIKAQEEPQTNLFYSLNFRYGQNRPHREVISNLDYYYRGIEAKLGWQTLGKTQWQQAYRFPSLGIGINWNSFNNEILGAPGAIYAFAAFPQFRYGPFRLDLEANLGLSYGLNPYDPVTNPENFAVGSPLNAYFGLYLEQSVKVSSNIELFVSEGLSHYSNATMNYPNLGLNVLMLKAGIKYQPQVTPFRAKEKIKTSRDWMLGLSLFSGAKKLTTPTPTYYEIGLAASINKRLSYKNQVALGYEAAYNQATQAMYWDRTLQFNELVSHAVYIGHEFLIDRFSIGTQFGIYLKNQPTDKFYYERVSLGFELFPNTRLILNLKAHYVKAEYLEFGMTRFIKFSK